MDRRLAALAAAVAMLTLAGCTGPEAGDADSSSGGATSIDAAVDPTGSIADRAEPDRYRVTYEVVQDDVVTTERVTVVRPYASRIETYSGDARNGDLLSVRASRLGALATKAPSSSSALVVPPSLASGDLRVREALAAGEADGRIERLGTRSVGGRPCTVFRLGGPVTAGYLTPYEQGGTQHADICVDATGIVVEERWVEGSKLLRRRTLVDAGTVPGDLTATDEDFTIEGAAAVSAEDGGGTLTALTPDSRLPDGFWESADPGSSPLAGFSSDGRWAVISPNITPQSSVATEQAGRRATVVEVWRRGIDLVLIEQGSTLDGTSPFDPHPDASPIELGTLGPGEAILDLRLSEVRAMTSSASFVRVAGTIALDDLAAVARSLRKHPGGALVALEQP